MGREPRHARSRPLPAGSTKLDSARFGSGDIVRRQNLARVAMVLPRPASPLLPLRRLPMTSGIGPREGLAFTMATSCRLDMHNGGLGSGDVEAINRPGIHRLMKPMGVGECRRLLGRWLPEPSREQGYCRRSANAE